MMLEGKAPPPGINPQMLMQQMQGPGQTEIRYIHAEGNGEETEHFKNELQSK